MSSNYEITEEQEVILPRRVQTLVEDYLKAGRQVNKNINLHYILETIDYHEKIFDDMFRRNPKSLKVTINAIYRVKNLKSNDEYFFYAATKTCANALNQLAEPFSYQYYGYHKSPVVRLVWDETRDKSEPKITGYNQGYELKWEKSEVKSLLDASPIPCEQFHVGNVGISASEPIANPYYQIQNLQDFLDGSHQDLMDLGRLGISYKEPSLYLIPSARKKERENREAAVGMRDPRVYA